MISWLVIALCVLAVAAILWRGRRRPAPPTVAQQQLGKVIDFPRREDRVEFRSCRDVDRGG